MTTTRAIAHIAQAAVFRLRPLCYAGAVPRHGAGEPDGGDSMETAKDTGEAGPPPQGAELHTIRQAVRDLTRGLLGAGAGIAKVPVNMLPAEPRHHFRAAGRELTLALASLVRALADRLEKLSDESSQTHR